MPIQETKKCNSCGGSFPLSLSYCPNDGQPLEMVDALIGQTLDGRYRLDSVLGTGGMGIVYRATHIHLDSEFAVKVLNPDLVANQSAIERFRREAKAAGRIHHPNAIKVTDFGVTAERIVYLVMEIVNGVSLRELMYRDGAFDYLRAVNIIRQVCAAVEAAHHSGVIHRDLKPDNILIERVGQVEKVKVLDFGIAKLKEQTGTQPGLTQAGTLIGTPQYMSPEQCQGKPLDPRSDVYAIGVVLYEMLSGQVPLDADSAIQVVVKQLHETPRPVRELSAEIPEGIAQVVMRALEKDPERRPPSAAELSAELQAAVEAEGGRLPATGSGPLYDPLASRTPTGTRVGPATPSQWPPSPPSSGSGAVTTPPEGAATPPSFETTAGARLLARLGQLPAAIKALAAVMLIAVVGITAYWSFSTSSPGKAGAGDQGTPRPDPPAPEGMVFIPGGKFKMGRDSGGEENESPAREVEVQPFFIDQLEVTNQEYKKFVDATGHPAPQHWKNGSYVPDEATLPVTYVTWEDATAYARWAEKRLPTEAEWEYTARGGAQRLYPWGDQWQDGYANVNRKDRNKPAPVRGFETDRSPFGDGIYGLAGNVSEWVQDSYIPKYGGPADERLRVYRGGNFFDVPRSSTFRYADFPRLPEEATQRREYERYVFPFVGFRCAKDVVP